MNSTFASGAHTAVNAVQTTRMAAPALAAPAIPAAPALKLSTSTCDQLAKLALRANLLSRHEAEEAYDIARSLNKSVDQVIMTSSFVTQDQYNKCQRALYYIERELCTEALAVAGLNMACKKLLSFEDGMRYFGWGW